MKKDNFNIRYHSYISVVTERLFMMACLSIDLSVDPSVMLAAMLACGLDNRRSLSDLKECRIIQLLGSAYKMCSAWFQFCTLHFFYSRKSESILVDMSVSRSVGLSV